MDDYIYTKLDVITFFQIQEVINKIKRYLIFGDLKPVYLDFFKTPDLSDKLDLEDFFMKAQGEENAELFLSIVNGVRPEFRKNILKYCDSELRDIFQLPAELINQARNEEKHIQANPRDNLNVTNDRNQNVSINPEKAKDGKEELIRIIKFQNDKNADAISLYSNNESVYNENACMVKPKKLI